MQLPSHIPPSDLPPPPQTTTGPVNPVKQTEVDKNAPWTPSTKLPVKGSTEATDNKAAETLVGRHRTGSASLQQAPKPKSTGSSASASFLTSRQMTVLKKSFGPPVAIAPKQLPTADGEGHDVGLISPPPIDRSRSDTVAHMPPVDRPTVTPTPSTTPAVRASTLPTTTTTAPPASETVMISTTQPKATAPATDRSEGATHLTDLKEAKQKLGTLQDDLAELQSKLKDIKDLKAKLTKAPREEGQDRMMASQDKLIEQLEGKISAKESDIKELNQSIANLKQAQPSLSQRVRSLPSSFERKATGVLRKITRAHSAPAAIQTEKKNLKDRILDKLPSREEVKGTMGKIGSTAMTFISETMGPGQATRKTSAKSATKTSALQPLPDVQGMDRTASVALFLQLGHVRREYNKKSPEEKLESAIGFKDGEFRVVKAKDTIAQEAALIVGGQLGAKLGEQLNDLQKDGISLRPDGQKAAGSNIRNAVEDLKEANKNVYDSNVLLRQQINSYITNEAQVPINNLKHLVETFENNKASILSLGKALANEKGVIELEIGNIKPEAIAITVDTIKTDITKWESYLQDFDPKKEKDAQVNSGHNNALKGTAEELAKEAYKKVRNKDTDPLPRALLDEMAEIARDSGPEKQSRVEAMNAKIDGLSSDEAKKAMQVCFAIKLTSGAEPIPANWTMIMNNLGELGRSISG